MASQVIAPALTVADLRIELAAHDHRFSPVDGVSLQVRSGETLGIVGESGSGKSLTLRAISGILPDAGIQHGRVDARRTAMVFQEPLLALNPTMRVGDLIAEAVRARTGVRARAARARAIELMTDVGIPRAAERARAWPHELSGGLRQRVMIAAALATDPDVLLCDEPTTALDATVQAQILTLLKRLTAERGMAMVFVSHDLGVIGRISDRIAVMYAGRLVELGDAAEVLAHPRHPYTVRLLGCTPSSADTDQPLATIAGTPPDPRRFPAGCRFAARCPHATAACADADYVLAPGARTSCIRAGEIEELNS